MILFVFLCFFVWCYYLLGGVKGWGDELFLSLIPPSLVMSSPFLPSPFSFKNDASAPDIVEAMEQVRIPASLCLK